MTSKMDRLTKPRKIDVFVFDGVNILDIAGPVQAFDNARVAENRMYVHRFVSLDGKSVRASCGLILSADGKLAGNSKADDLLIPGGIGVDAQIDNRALRRVICAWNSRSGEGRLISICSGALLLAAGGGA